MNTYVNHLEKRAAVAAEHSRSTLGAKLTGLFFAPFIYAFKMIFSVALFSAIGFLIFYFSMHSTPEKEKKYAEIMKATKQVPAVLGGLAYQADMKGVASTLGYDPQSEDAQKSKELVENLCGQLVANQQFRQPDADAASQPTQEPTTLVSAPPATIQEDLPWKAQPAPREDEQPQTPSYNYTISVDNSAPTLPPEQPASPATPPVVAQPAVPAEPEKPTTAAPVVIAQAAPAAPTAAAPSTPASPPVASTPAAATTPLVAASPAIDLNTVPAELDPIITALRYAKNLDKIKEKLAVRYVGEHGEGAVLFLDKLLQRDNGTLRAPALDSLRRINTPEAQAIIYKYTSAGTNVVPMGQPR